MPHNILAIGEILWDVFPDGPRFGGAPANFGCSSAELGQEKAVVTMVSAIGDDELGRRVLKAPAVRGVQATLTCGPNGAVIVSEDSVSELPGTPERVIDTVWALVMLLRLR